MMWSLLAASIVTIAIAVERTVFYRRSASDMQVLQGEFLSAVRAKNFDAAAALCKKAGGTVGAVLEKAIAERNAVINAEQYLSGAAAYSAARLKDHLNYVSAIVTLAPLMGLLGTVTGMIRSFDILSISEGQPFAITGGGGGGVAEALVATGFGLLVAIIAMLVYVWLSQRANRIIEDLEAAASAYLACLSEK